MIKVIASLLCGMMVLLLYAIYWGVSQMIHAAAELFLLLINSIQSLFQL